MKNGVPNARELAALEKVWIAELPTEIGAIGGMPAQIGKKIAADLEGFGLIQPLSVRLGGRFPMIVSGHVLTHAGRYLYCSTCTDEPDGEPS